MFISSFGYTLYMASGIYVYECNNHNSVDGICNINVVYSLVILCAILNGICASTLWVS